MNANNLQNLLELIALLPDPALLLDGQDRILATNPPFARLLAWSPEELARPDCPFALGQAPTPPSGSPAVVMRRRARDGREYDFLVSSADLGTGRLQILRDVTAEMEHRRRLEALLAISVRLPGFAREEELYTFLGEQIRQHLRAESSSIILVDHQSQELFFRWCQPRDSEVARRLSCLRFPAHQGIAGRVVSQGEPVIVSDVASDPDFYNQVDAEAGFTTRSVIYVPLKVGGRVIGVLGAVNRLEGTFGQRDLEMLLMLANTVALSVENARVKEMERLVCTDPLTRLANRRFLETALSEEFSRALRHGQPLSLVMIDLDRFKEVNDQLGHPEGDRVLCLVAQAIDEQLRGHDKAARLGGDEFVVLLPGCGREQALKAAERLRQAMLAALPAELKFVGASLGAATLEPERPLSGHEELLRRADEALLAAKQAGRNRVLHIADLEP